MDQLYRPREARALEQVRWLWLPGRDPRHVAGRQTAEFHYVIHLDAESESAVLHCLAGGTFSTEVNGHIAGHKADWGTFDREDIRAQLHVGQGVRGDNEIIVRTTARAADPPNTVADSFAAVRCRRARSNHRE